MEKETKSRRWKQNPEAVKSDILRVARTEFARSGLSGARIEDIASGTKTSKRMIFYYFGDKQSLYEAVLEDCYAEVRAGEAELDLEGLAPDKALKALIEFTFDHHRRNPEFIRLVMIENIHEARHLDRMARLHGQNLRAIGVVEKICEAGLEAGLFREDVSPVALHWQISAVSFFNVANRATFSSNFGAALFEEAGQALLKDAAVRSILCSVLVHPETMDRA
ncbi:TetR family transcriptional regulator [Salipiger bermudensis]|mgnify:CR=1 FL=1|uniref:TetR family transcriptional regulator n=1 Tax=Salipiger bermudensis TaxID=344736 RepID=UPI000C8FE3EC|nr:TetR family transcriptional regulator [Salipiger bermudensis]MAE92819.1 TetR family transcriptional regulator [Pelagibaca sp.]MBN9678486.1 TetR family transcriptional regulator [Salipiger bermudensis]MCA1288225.1 TetR family transcriptional regulator [Salipiger bermudensis]